MNYYLSKIMLYHLIHQMDHEGHSITKIAEHFGLNWRTVKRALSMSEKEHQLSLEKGKTRSKSLDVYEEFIREKLSLYPETPAAQMHDWLKEHYHDFPAVSQKTVFNYTHFLRNKYNIPKTEASREYAAVAELPYGKQAQVDFGFYNLKTTTGKTKKVQFFTLVLARSRFKYVLFSDHPFDGEAVILAHEKAFEFIKGVPEEIVYDQDRLFIVSENLGDYILTGDFRAYLKQRSFSTWFCRKADPESKGKVENVVKYVKQNFLYNRLYRDLETLNDEVRDWLYRTANALPHGTTKKIPCQEHQIEQAFLNPWHPIILPEPKYPAHVVRKDNMISWKGNLYSVPLGTYQNPGSQVLIKATTDQLVVLDQQRKEICRHQQSLLKGQKFILTDHVRDKRHAIIDMMDEFSQLMPDKLKALDWVLQIKDHKPRYIRDQVQLLKATVEHLDPLIAGEALDYCIKYKIISAVDFKSVAEKFKHQVAPQEAKIVPINPLTGQAPALECQEPEKSDLSNYQALFS